MSAWAVSGAREARHKSFKMRSVRKPGTIVEATIIAAPSSTKNAAKARDPEMKQAMKGKAWYFGMKLHVGTDCKGRVAPAG